MPSQWSEIKSLHPAAVAISARATLPQRTQWIQELLSKEWTSPKNLCGVNLGSRDSLKGTIFSSELLVFLQMFSSSDSGTLGKLTLGQFGAPFSIYNHIYINVNYVFQDCSNCALWYLKALSACCHQLDRIGQNWTIQMWGESSFRLHDSVKFGLNIQQLSSPSVFCWENIDSPRFVRQFQALDNGLAIHGESG